MFCLTNDTVLYNIVFLNDMKQIWSDDQHIEVSQHHTSQKHICLFYVVGNVYYFHPLKRFVKDAR